MRANSYSIVHWACCFCGLELDCFAASFLACLLIGGFFLGVLFRLVAPWELVSSGSFQGGGVYFSTGRIVECFSPGEALKGVGDDDVGE